VSRRGALLAATLVLGFNALASTASADLL